MKKDLILVAADALPQHERMLAKAVQGRAEVQFKAAKEVTAADVRYADIIIGNPRAALLSSCERLKWLQLQSAGTDDYRACDALMKKEVLFSNGSGVYGLAISEFMLTVTLMMLKKMNAYMRNQKAHAWKKEGQIASIYGSTVLILGLGDIGSNFGKRIRLLGGRVLACQLAAAAPNECADEIHAMCDLDDLLPLADVVAVCLPGNEKTYHLFQKERFQRMKRGACFLNIGRGSIVNTEDLLSALECGQLAQAALDVIEGEPLPQQHPAWDQENLILTPHVAGGTYLPETNHRYFAFVAENLKLYYAGKPIKNQVDPITGCRMESLQ